MNIRWNIILGVIALALLGWYYSLNQDHKAIYKASLKSLIARNTSVIKWKPLYSRLKVKTISRDFRQSGILHPRRPYGFYFAVSLSFDVSLDNKDKEAKTDKIQLENKIGSLARKGKINERSNALS